MVTKYGEGSVELDEFINKEDREGNIPLFVAFEKRRFGIVKVLIELGVNVHVKDGLHENIIHVAVRGQNVEALRELLNSIHAFHGTKTLTSLFHDTNNLDETPLYLAANCRNVEIAAVLIEAGADIHKRSGTNPSPYCHVMKKGYSCTEMKELFLRYDRRRGFVCS